MEIFGATWPEKTSRQLSATHWKKLSREKWLLRCLLRFRWGKLFLFRSTVDKHKTVVGFLSTAQSFIHNDYHCFVNFGFSTQESRRYGKKRRAGWKNRWKMTFNLNIGIKKSTKTNLWHAKTWKTISMETSLFVSSWTLCDSFLSDNFFLWFVTFLVNSKSNISESFAWDSLPKPHKKLLNVKLKMLMICMFSEKCLVGGMWVRWGLVGGALRVQLREPWESRYSQAFKFDKNWNKESYDNMTQHMKQPAISIETLSDINSSQASSVKRLMKTVPRSIRLLSSLENELMMKWSKFVLLGIKIRRVLLDHVHKQCLLGVTLH